MTIKSLVMLHLLCVFVTPAILKNRSIKALEQFIFNKECASLDKIGNFVL